MRMKQQRMSQPELFEQLGELSNLLPEEQQHSLVVQLAQLMRAVIQTIDKELGDEQD